MSEDTAPPEAADVTEAVEAVTAETDDMSVADPKAPKRGLGRGLNALFEDVEDEESAPAQAATDSPAPERSRHMMGVDQLTPRADQPRKHFDHESLEELAASIKEYGVLQPLLVRPVKDSEDAYEIIAGERRWRASQIAQLHEVPVIVVDLEDEDAFKIAMIENLQREDLNIVDEANGYQTLIENFGYTQEKLADAMGKSRSYIANTVRLRQLPDFVLTHLSAGSISAGHARVLLNAREPGLIVDAIIKKNLSVRETEKLVDAANALGAERAGESSGEESGEKTSRSKKEDTRDVNIIHLEQSLAQATGLKIFINTKYTGKTGKVEIAFKNLDQLDEILKYLTKGATGGVSAPVEEDIEMVEASEAEPVDEAGETPEEAAMEEGVTEETEVTPETATDDAEATEKPIARLLD